MSNDFRTGDKVKVTLEGEVVGKSEVGPAVYVKAAHGREHTVWHDREGVTVEKVEPPVETFKPGDTVKGKILGYVHTLTANGYVRHSDWVHIDSPSGRFTSADYEKVRLEPRPF